jgi:hypothetical protein
MVDQLGCCDAGLSPVPASASATTRSHDDGMDPGAARNCRVRLRSGGRRRQLRTWLIRRGRERRVVDFGENALWLTIKGRGRAAPRTRSDMLIWNVYQPLTWLS